MKKILEAQRVIRTKREEEDLVESVLLRLWANWERFVDEHLIDCVNVDDSKLSEFLGITIPRHPKRSLCEALLYGGSYRDYRSFGDLKDFSKKVLPEVSNPLLSVGIGRSNRIDKAFKLRNYLAHYSSASKRSVKLMYSNVYKMKRFVESGRFLKGHGGRRLWSYFDAFEGASNDMKDRYGKP